MARTLTVTLSSDKSGEEIPRGTGARVRILFYDENKVDMRADLTDVEADRLIKDYKLKPVHTRAPRQRNQVST
jgi:hypothetical protein